MKLLLVRHGRPVDRETFAASGHGDELRPLSAEGRRDMRRVAIGVARVAGGIDVLASSPFARAVETAALLARELGKIQPIELPSLAPGGDEDVLSRWVSRQAADATVVLVGHEPTLRRLASLLLAGGGEFVRLKHGGACMLRFAAKPQPGGAKLLWLLTPRQLRRLKKL